MTKDVIVFLVETIYPALFWAITAMWAGFGTWTVLRRPDVAGDLMASSRKAIRTALRDAVVDVAIETLARNPGASLSEIELRAGVGRATLHRHFSARDDLIRALVERSMSETEATTQAITSNAGSAEKTLMNMLKAVIPLGDRYHFLVSQTATNQTLQARYNAELKWVEVLVDRLKKENVIDRQVPTRWVVANIDMQIWLAWSEFAARNLALAEAPRVVYRTLVSGLQTTKGAQFR